MNERRRKMQLAVQAEKARNAAGLTSEQAAQTVANGVGIVYSKHFMIEPIPPADSDSDVDEYAVYRVTDLLTSQLSDQAGTPEPVHVFESAADAARFVVIADTLVDGETPDATPVPEGARGFAGALPVSSATTTAVPVVSETKSEVQ